MNINQEKAWTTHIGILVKVLLISEGDVIELGAGPYSTPLLHWICKDMHRKLISYENNPEYNDYARQFRSYFHKVVFVKDWDEIDCATHRGVVLIDHDPMTRRAVDAIRFKDSADFIVLHDTEKEGYYSEVWPHFKYIYIWKASRPWVSVVSNFKDVNGLAKPLHFIP